MDIHSTYVLFFLFLVACRSYFAGISDATGERIDRRQEGIFYYFRYLIGVPYYFSLIAYAVNEHSLDWARLSLPDWIRWAGIILMILGVLTLTWVHITLGKNFTDTVIVRKKGHLITQGPYYYVRHPMYLTFFLIAVGSSLAAENWLMGITGILLTLLILVLRTPIEENKLLARYGDEWLDYKKKTPKLFI